MTSEEIKQTCPVTVPDLETPVDHDLRFWVKEIAYQLAVMNEHKAMEPVLAAQARLMSVENNLRSLITSLPRVEPEFGGDGLAFQPKPEGGQ